jgi:DNA-damage-inducible protein J
MAQTMVNFRMDETVKKNMEIACREMGMSMTTAFTIFATKVGKEKRIPFEIIADPFYSESNMQYLRRVISDIETGKATLTEHELIEE